MSHGLCGLEQNGFALLLGFKFLLFRRREQNIV
jgi:hypothetical protein